MRTLDKPLAHQFRRVVRRADYNAKDVSLAPRDFPMFRAKIIKGKDVQIKIGSAEFKFKPEHLRIFANLPAISNPASF